MFLTTQRILMTETPGDTPAGAGGEAAPVVAAPAAAPSVLGSGADVTPAAINDLIPEKYRVSKEDGTFDIEASARKQAEGYANLAKKLGEGKPADAAPESPDAYEPKVEIEGFQWAEVKADPDMQSFLKSAHAKGFSNEDLSFVLTEYHNRVGAALEGNAALTLESCEAELAKSWTTPEAMTQGKRDAFKAFSAYGPKAGVTIADLEASGAANNPAVLRLLASIAPDLGEDRVPSGLGMSGAESVESLMTSPAYLDTKHADHAAVSKKIQEHYQRKYGNTPAI